MSFVVYEYRCKKCGYHMETPERSESHKCPSCSGKMNRVWKPPAIIFKGGGFTRGI